MTTYYVFAAYPNQWATVHEGNCSHCRNGRGQDRVGKRPGKKLTATDWFGPFDTRAQAFAKAKQTGLKTVRGCGHCQP